MVQPCYNLALHLQIETKCMMRNKTIVYRFIYFRKSFGKMPTANTFISRVKAGRTLVTSPDIFIAISSPDLHH